MSSKLQQPRRRIQQDGPAISSMSLGRAWAHNLTHKLDMAQKYGFKGLELFYEDLEYFALELEQKHVKQRLDPLPSAAEVAAAAAVAATETNPEDGSGVGADTNTGNHNVTPRSSTSSASTLNSNQDRTTLMINAAKALRAMCDARSINIISMQPFYHYEGLLDRDLHASKIAALKNEWLPIAKILGTDLILIPSNFLSKDQLVPDSNSELIISDLHEVASLGLQCSPPIRFCYESLAWGTHARRWQDAWTTVQRVDMPNFGTCLDAFNIAGLVYADPATESGLTRNAHAAMAQTISDLVITLQGQAHKIFIVQVADAEKLAEPLVEGHQFYDAAQPARMSWSRNCRVFYGEKVGYLPVAPILRAIVHDLGYTGWISAELFNKRSTEPDSAVPEEMARRGRQSWTLLERDILGVNGDVSQTQTQTPTVTVTNSTEPWGQTLKKLWRSSRRRGSPAVLVETVTETNYGKR